MVRDPMDTQQDAEAQGTSEPLDGPPESRSQDSDLKTELESLARLPTPGELPLLPPREVSDQAILPPRTTSRLIARGQPGDQTPLVVLPSLEHLLPSVVVPLASQETFRSGLQTPLVSDLLRVSPPSRQPELRTQEPPSPLLEPPLGSTSGPVQRPLFPVEGLELPPPFPGPLVTGVDVPPPDGSSPLTSSDSRPLESRPLDPRPLESRPLESRPLESRALKETPPRHREAELRRSQRESGSQDSGSIDGPSALRRTSISEDKSPLFSETSQTISPTPVSTLSSMPPTPQGPYSPPRTQTRSRLQELPLEPSDTPTSQSIVSSQPVRSLVSHPQHSDPTLPQGLEPTAFVPVLDPLRFPPPVPSGRPDPTGGEREALTPTPELPRGRLPGQPQHSFANRLEESVSQEETPHPQDPLSSSSKPETRPLPVQPEGRAPLTEQGLHVPVLPRVASQTVASRTVASQFPPPQPTSQQTFVMETAPDRVGSPSSLPSPSPRFQASELEPVSPSTKGRLPSSEPETTPTRQGLEPISSSFPPDTEPRFPQVEGQSLPHLPSDSIAESSKVSRSVRPVLPQGLWTSDPQKSVIFGRDESPDSSLQIPIFKSHLQKISDPMFPPGEYSSLTGKVSQPLPLPVVLPPQLGTPDERPLEPDGGDDARSPSEVTPLPTSELHVEHLPTERFRQLASSETRDTSPPMPMIRSVPQPGERSSGQTEMLSREDASSPETPQNTQNTDTSTLKRDASVITPDPTSGQKRESLEPTTRPRSTPVTSRDLLPMSPLLNTTRETPGTEGLELPPDSPNSFSFAQTSPDTRGDAPNWERLARQLAARLGLPLDGLPLDGLPLDGLPLDSLPSPPERSPERQNTPSRPLVRPRPQEELESPSLTSKLPSKQENPSKLEPIPTVVQVPVGSVGTPPTPLEPPTRPRSRALVSRIITSEDGSGTTQEDVDPLAPGSVPLVAPVFSRVSGTEDPTQPPVTPWKSARPRANAQRHVTAVQKTPPPRSPLSSDPNPGRDAEVKSPPLPPEPPTPTGLPVVVRTQQGSGDNPSDSSLLSVLVTSTPRETSSVSGSSNLRSSGSPSSLPPKTPPPGPKTSVSPSPGPNPGSPQGGPTQVQSDVDAEDLEDALFDAGLSDDHIARKRLTHLKRLITLDEMVGIHQFLETLSPRAQRSRLEEILQDRTRNPNAPLNIDIPTHTSPEELTEALQGLEALMKDNDMLLDLPDDGDDPSSDSTPQTLDRTDLAEVAFELRWRLRQQERWEAEAW